MSKLQELIKELCPDGVEFRKLGEVCEIYTGGEPPKDTIKGDNKDEKHVYPVWANGKEVYGYSSTYKIDKDATVISSIGANTGSIYFRKAYFTPIIRLKVLVPKNNNLISKYLYYYLSTVTFVVKSSSVPNMNANEVKKLEIPLPSLEVQNEIVRILDTFTAHTAELQAELQARKEQYEYYRNKLLTFDENDERVKWMKLGEIGTFVRGNGLQKKDFTETGVGCIHYGQIYTYYGTSTDTTKSFVPYELAQKLTKVKSGNLVIACTSENIEDVCKAVVWLGEEDIVTGGHACVFAHNEIPKYIAYFFQTEYFFQQKKKYARGAKVIDIKVSDLEKISIPVPPLSEQKRIISILDKFESLVNDLSEGLPAEIAAVQEQYEYYRNKLLTFKRKS